ncbi:PLP-dependent cysteine synthase family protein [Ructibacterium gallinarum]|uniref:Cysteine synthase family protein n=1 Tax=Ructibacterium gallinarum TaxID=2779355 RepID=A0A9D5LZV1_9FIRM|nr:cysteine synthase family protein [Ructibacterium gallinarum]MBE5039561.1 cysteine synthase family protein [Ructibacterium gallinarum]
MSRLESIRAMISNTPLLEIDLTYRGKPMKIYAKAEYYNLTGSIKDRVAFYILNKAEKSGLLKPGDIIAEATSGNTGIAFCAAGTYLKHKVIIYMPDWMSQERIRLMESFGAEVRLVSKEEGGFLGSIAMTEELAKQGGVFLPGQFSNIENINAHIDDTGAEILRQLSAIGKQPGGVVAGVGTGGTIMGLARAFRAANPKTLAFPLEPANSPTLSTGYKTGNHKIQGISDEFIPSIVDLNELNDVVSVDDVDSIIMAQRLSRELGIGVGISSGANFIGAVSKAGLLPEDSVMVTVFADDNKKYLSTDYNKTWEPKENYISSEIVLKGYRAFR